MYNCIHCSLVGAGSADLIPDLPYQAQIMTQSSPNDLHCSAKCSSEFPGGDCFSQCQYCFGVSLQKQYEMWQDNNPVFIN